MILIGSKPYMFVNNANNDNELPFSGSKFVNVHYAFVHEYYYGFDSVHKEIGYIDSMAWATRC